MQRPISYFDISISNADNNIEIIIIFENSFKVTPCVIAQRCGQTLGLGLVDKNRTVVNY